MSKAMNIFEHLESEVRSYCRAFPVVFAKAKGPYLYDEDGTEYLDFFAGAGTLNYGHNNPAIKRAILNYLEEDGPVHALDMMTTAKRAFLEGFERIILQPRGLDYKVQFTGPTGANAVEAALKLARKVKGRTNVIAFTNGYHGLSGGALATTGNRHFRHEAFVTRLNVSVAPFDGYMEGRIDTLDYLRRLLTDKSSGVDIPAAIILETIQAEGGVNVARREWLQGLEKICRDFDILLIVDDIQVGNGRTGSFFSFDASGIRPDIVTLSKAIGGLGLPMSLVLMNRQIDAWKPAEHTGTFRGNNLAFVGARAALDYWATDALSLDIRRREQMLVRRLQSMCDKHDRLPLKIRGRGLIYGLEMPRPEQAKAVSVECFRNHLIIELAGPEDEVVKFLPPLILDDDVLNRGLDIVEAAVDKALGHATT